MSRTPRIRARIAVLAVATTLALGGCGAGDVELNGGIFDALGVNNQTQKSEPKLAARTPLVVPPATDRLPQPGLPPEAQATDMTASINDPDRAAVVDRSELERQQAAYCSKHYELAKAHGDNDADQATGPLGPCRTTILTSIKKWTGGETEEQPEQ